MTDKIKEAQLAQLTDSALKIIMEASPVGIIIFGSDARIIYANSLASKIFAKSATEISNLRCGDFIDCANRHKDNKGCGFTDSCAVCPLFQAICSSVSGGSNEVLNETKAFLKRDSGLSNIWVKYKVTSVIIEGSKFALMTIDDITGYKQDEEKLNNEDITEQKQAEEKVKHLNEVLRAIRNVNQLITQEKDRDQLLLKSCQNLVETRGYYNAWICLLDNQNNLSGFYSAGLGDKALILKKHLEKKLPLNCLESILEGERVLVLDDPYFQCSNCPLKTSYNLRAGLSGGLEYRGRFFGILSVSTPGKMAHDKEELELFEELVGDISFALDNLEREEERKKHSENLQMYELIISTIKDPMSIIDRNYVYRSVNKAYLYKFSKNSQDEIVGHKVEELIGSSTFHELVKPKLDRCLNGEEVDYEQWFDTPFGEKVCRAMHYYPYFDQKGDVQGVVVNVRDITEKKRMETAIKESHQRVLTILNNINAVVYVSDMETHEILFVNQYVKNKLGDIEGRKCWSALQSVQKGPCDFCTNKKLVDAEGNPTGVYRWEFQNTKTGKCYDCHDSAIKWIDGRLVRMEIAIDITDRKEAEEQLNWRSRLQTLLLSISSKYINISLENIESAINSSLHDLGKFVGADRSYIFHYNFDKDMCTNIHEWCRDGIDTQINALQSVPLSMIQDMVKKHRCGEFFYIPDMFSMPPSAFQKHLELQNIKSLLTVPMMLNNECIGFVGFDWVRHYHHLYSETEQDLLMVFAQMLVNIHLRKQNEDALRESESAVRKKLQAILEPEGDLGILNLADIIDVHSIQSMMEDFYQITKIGGAVVDLSGKILVSVGFQDVCYKFHRAHPETRQKCLESDIILSKGIPPGTFKAYKCKNNMWDMATPIMMDGRHVGNIFLGQFFYENEVPDYELFRNQARRYGFNEAQYIAAIDRVPRWNPETIESVVAFYTKLAKMISSLSYSKIKLSRALAQQEATLNQLSESENKYRTLVENANDIIYTLTSEGIFTYVSPNWTQLLGHQISEVEGNSFAPFVHPDDVGACYKFLRKVFESGEKQSGVEYRVLHKNGQWRWHTSNASAKRDKNGHVIEYMGIARDITEHKRAQEEKGKLQAQFIQAQKMESVGRLAGGVAHDINNKMLIISGYAELVQETLKESDPIYEFVGEIIDSCKKSTDIVNQLLAFARKQTISPKVCDLDEIVESMLKMIRRLIGEDIELIWMPGASTWPVKIDPAQIDQILANLCVNARDAITGVGKITIETEHVTIDEEYCYRNPGFLKGEYVMIAISDNGVGMDKETISNIFEPFFTTKPAGIGTGLGLATVYGIVKQNNGFINVYSEPGEGTTFRIYLPRYTGKDEEIQTENATEIPKGHGETVLMVEDEKPIMKMSKLMLEKIGYLVLSAGTPSEALHLAKQHSGTIDLLITDVIMPEMNGRDLASQITDLYPDIKTLFMSGYTANVIAHHGVLDKGVHFIQKPFSKKDIAAKIRKLLEVK